MSAAVATIHAAELPTDGIETTRFRLRPIAATDLLLYQEIYCNPDTMRYVGPPLSITEATRSFHAAVKQTAAPDSNARFLVVIAKDSGLGVGICGVCFGVPGWGSAEIGIMLLGSARGHGYSHEVLGGFVDYVFLSSKASQVVVRYAARQTAVVCLNNGLGFVINKESSSDSDTRQRAHIDRNVWQVGVQSINRG